MNGTKKNPRSSALTIRRMLTGLIGEEKGAVVIMVALLLIVLIGFAGLVVDVGHLFVIDSSLQTAADSASLAAAASLGYGPDEAKAQAKLFAQKHGIHGSPVALLLSDIELGTWDKGTKTFTVLAPDQEASADTVRVTAQRSSARNNPISLFFMRVFGHETSDVGVISVAYAQGGLCGAIIGEKRVTLNSSTTTDSYDTGQYSPANAKNNGDVCSCGDIELNSSSGVNGDANPGEGHEVTLNSDSYVTGSTKPGACPELPPVELGTIATMNDNGNIGLTEEGEDPFSSGPYDLEVNNSDTLILPGGEYYFTSFELNSASTIVIEGPTVMYVTGPFTLNSSGIVNPGHNPADLIIFVSSIEEVSINSSTDFYGVIYAPNAQVVINSSSNFFGALMADEVTFNSSVEFHYDESLNDNALLDGLVSSAFSNSILVQ